MNVPRSENLDSSTQPLTTEVVTIKRDSQGTADPATQFTLLCLRGRWDPAALEAARNLGRAGRLDWNTWCETAQAASLQPLLYRILHGHEVVPAAVEEKLQAAYYRNAVRNARAFRELGQVLRGLAAKGLAVIVLKGAALAETVYGNIALRPMQDVDLLVHREDVLVALEALPAPGYAPRDTDAHTSITVVLRGEGKSGQPGMSDRVVEVHWSPLHSPHYQYGPPLAWLWETARPVCVEGAAALTLGPEAQLLHLCAHLALHHGGQGLLWHHDLAEVLHFYRDQLNWELLLAKARECDLVLPLQQVLPRVVAGWAAPAPPEVLEQLRALEPSAGEVKVFHGLTAEEQSVARRLWTNLANTPDWSQRLRYGWGILFPSPAYMRHCYNIPHSLLLPFYYPYRWWLGMAGALKSTVGK